MDLRQKPSADIWLEYEVHGVLTLDPLSTADELETLRPFDLEGFPQRHLVLDLQHATFLDSSGIGWLLSVNRLLRDRDLRLVLYAAPPIIERITSMMRLGDVIPILSSLRDVRDYFSSLDS